VTFRPSRRGRRDRHTDAVQWHGWSGRLADDAWLRVLANTVAGWTRQPRRRLADWHRTPRRSLRDVEAPLLALCAITPPGLVFAGLGWLLGWPDPTHLVLRILGVPVLILGLAGSVLGMLHLNRPVRDRRPP